MLRLFKHQGIRIFSDSLTAYTEETSSDWQLPAQKVHLQAICWHNETTGKGGSLCVGKSSVDEDDTVASGRKAALALVASEAQLQEYMEQRDSDDASIKASQKIARLEAEVSARDNQIAALKEQSAPDPEPELDEPATSGDFEGMTERQLMSMSWE